MLQRARAIFLWQQAAKENPFAMLDAAGKAPASAEPVAASTARPCRSACRSMRSVCALSWPTRLAGPALGTGKLPVVHSDHAVNPGGGHAAFGQCHLNAIKHARIQLVAAPALGCSTLNSPAACMSLTVSTATLPARSASKERARQNGRQCPGTFE